MKSVFCKIVIISLIISGCSREWNEPLLIAFDNGANIFIMDENGQKVKQIAVGTHPSFSPDGEYIVYRRATNTLYRVDIDKGEEVLLYSTPGVLYPYPAWSPDGEKIAFIEDGVLYTVNPDGTGQTRISLSGSNQIPITWSSDSQFIICSNNLITQVLYYNKANVNSAPVSTQPVSIFNISYSPQGDKITYTDGVNLYIAKKDFTLLVLLTNTADINPSWSPDGQRLVYESSSGEIRIISSSGGEYIQLTGSGYHNPCFQFKPR